MPDTRRELQLRLPEAYRHAAKDLAYAQNPDQMIPGHRMRLLVDGDQTFPDMLDAIKGARYYVHLETYILMHDTVGELFAGPLCERAGAGVDVRVMYDSVGSLGLSDAYVDRLRRAGVQVVEFGPINRWRNRRKWSRRDHRKILVVDGRIGFVGGINIGDDYAPRDIGGKGWRDTHMRIEGPVVGDLETMFRAVWQQQGGAPYPPRPRDSDESLAVDDSEFCHVIGSDLRGRRSAPRRHYLHAMRAARDHIYIANAYFVPDRRIRRALCRAAERGVDVRVIVSLVSDIKLVQYAGEYTYADLMKSGVIIHGWDDAHMHSKVAVIDGVWSTVGSYNLDYVSLFYNLEVIAEIIGRKFGRETDAMFRADFARAAPLDVEEWHHRPWWKKALCWLFYRFRRWL